MENDVTPAAEKTPEQIEAEMFETRESLTEKVAALEQQVVGTVRTAAETLTETVDKVKSFVTTAPEAVHDTMEQVTSAVSETVEQVKERVRQTFDVRGWVEARPWACVGASVGVGFVASYLLGDGTSRVAAAMSKASAPDARMSPHPYSSPSEPAAAGWFDNLFASASRKLREKVKDLTETAIEAASNALNRTVRDQLPKLVDEAASRFVSGRAETNGRHPMSDVPA
jgi:ElaB/YqjD/DUF883 family membrane-anchored ribosome-binding protein